MAGDFDQSVRAVCEKLGISLTELPDWNCCGASSAHFLDDELAIRLPARNLLMAEKIGHELLVPCAACFHRLKHAEKELKEDPTRWADGKYEGKATIYHVNEFFDRPQMISMIMDKVKKPLAELKCVAYYGCLSQRPAKITDSVASENPVSMDHILKAIGAETLPWSFKTCCCGASLTLARTDLVRKLSGDIFDGAVEAGAQCIVTDCPMCQSNLDTRQKEIEAERGKRYNLPVLYVTELMALAFNDDRARDWWSKHFVDPTDLLRSKNLL